MSEHPIDINAPAKSSGARRAGSMPWTALMLSAAAVMLCSSIVTLSGYGGFGFAFWLDLIALGFGGVVMVARRSSLQ